MEVLQGDLLHLVREFHYREICEMLYRLVDPRPWDPWAAWVNVNTPYYWDDLILDRLYAGWTAETVPVWEGFPLVNVEAELYGLDVQGFVWGGLGDIVISDDLLRILREEGITGIDTRSVDVWAVRVDGHDLMEEQPGYVPPTLHRLVATGIVQGTIHSRMHRDPDWPIVLDLTTWDGSDVVVVWDAWLFVFVSQRFVDCLERHNINNCRVVPGREFTANSRNCIAFPREVHQT